MVNASLDDVETLLHFGYEFANRQLAFGFVVIVSGASKLLHLPIATTDSPGVV